MISLGGLMEKETAEEIEKWRKEMKDTVWSAMIHRVSLVILRATTRVYEGQCCDKGRLSKSPTKDTTGHDFIYLCTTLTYIYSY